MERPDLIVDDSVSWGWDVSHIRAAMNHVQPVDIQSIVNYKTSNKEVKMQEVNRLIDVLSVLYDYEYINLEKFYNDSSNKELLNILNDIESSGEVLSGQGEAVKELYENLNSFIKFETNYNSRIGDF